VSGERREVRATLDFFQDLDRQLPSERGPNGEPSTSDFQQPCPRTRFATERDPIITDRRTPVRSVSISSATQQEAPNIATANAMART